jgi:hypothetical protein
LNPKVLEEKYQLNKDKFHSYINNIKQNMKVDIYSIINTTLVSNPYATKFPLMFFINNKVRKENKIWLFLKSSFKFYIRSFYLWFGYLISYIIYKIYYKKNYTIRSGTLGIDIFFLVDNIIRDDKFNENYFKNLYTIIEKLKKDYIFIPRLYGVGKNPFKLVKLFKILNKDKRNFLFEFEYFTFVDFMQLFYIILFYPFKTLRLLQKEENNNDILFNIELIKDIKNTSFDSISRYVFGKNISNKSNINKIYSWGEFQVIERSFNYGIRKHTLNIKLFACQFYLNYEIYFNAYVDDIDYDMLSSPYKVLVNGKYYILNRDKIAYESGVSLRYHDIFQYKQDDGIKQENILILGSYIQDDTKVMLQSVNSFENVLFKNHPAVNINSYTINKNINIVDDNIYTLFKKSNIVLSVASGTSVEAVACGISVIIIASQDNLTANPLVEYGRGKIWDIAYSKEEVEILYNHLIKYRNKNQEEIKQIASWYKDNFFIEPTEENIVKVFELDAKED